MKTGVPILHVQITSVIEDAIDVRVEQLRQEHPALRWDKSAAVRHMLINALVATGAMKKDEVASANV